MKERGKKREDTQLKQRPNQLLLLFSPISEESDGGFAERGKAGFPPVRRNLQIPSSLRPGFWRFTHAINAAEPPPVPQQ